MEFLIKYLPLVRGLIPWLALSFTACFIAGFYDTFMERRFLKKRWGGNLLMILALYLLQFGRQRIFNALPTELLYSDMVISLDMLNLCSIYLVIAVVFYKAAMETRIFTAVTQMIICQVSGGIANGRFFRETLRKLTFESGWFIPSAYPIVRFDAFLLLRVVLVEGITLALEFAVIAKVKRMFRGRNVCVRRSELPVLILPSLLYLCWRLVECTYIGEIYYLNQNTVYEYEYEGFLRDYFGSPVIRFVVLGAILCVLKQFRDVISLTGERNSRILLEKQVSSMQEHLKEVERLQEGLRELKHDMKNTFLVASRMAVGEDSLKAANRAIEDAERANYDGLSSAKISGLDMEYQEKRLKELEALLESDGWVTARMPGQVLEVCLAVGERTRDGAAIVYAMDDGSKVIEATFDGEAFEYIEVGKEITMQTSDGQSTVPITYIEPTADENMRVLIFLENQELYIGQTVKLSYRAQSENYSACVPKSSLFTDDRSYVFVAQEWEGILGTEWHVKKVYVNVVDQTDTVAAISSVEITGGSRVVISSSGSLTDGAVVRVVDR